MRWGGKTNLVGLVRTCGKKATTNAHLFSRRAGRKKRPIVNTKLSYFEDGHRPQMFKRTLEWTQPVYFYQCRRQRSISELFHSSSCSEVFNSALYTRDPYTQRSSCPGYLIPIVYLIHVFLRHRSIELFLLFLRCQECCQQSNLRVPVQPRYGDLAGGVRGGRRRGRRGHRRRRRHRGREPVADGTGVTVVGVEYARGLAQEAPSVHGLEGGEHNLCKRFRD